MDFIKRNLFILGTAVAIILVWRGIWGLADLYLFPNDVLLSKIASVAIGLCALMLINIKKADVRELIE